jgi:hypothetical protein
MKNEPSPQSDLILYQTEDGRTRIQCRFEGETVWLSLNQMADLFQRDKSVISRHIKNVFEEGELAPAATVAKSATVQTEGGKQVTREIEFYDLDVIISVGYRVKSQRGTQFRIAQKFEHDFSRFRFWTHRVQNSKRSEFRIRGALRHELNWTRQA